MRIGLFFILVGYLIIVLNANSLTFDSLQSKQSVFKYPPSQLFNCEAIQEPLSTTIDIGSTPNKKSCILLCNGKLSNKFFSKLLSENYEYNIKLKDKKASIPIGDPNTVTILFLDLSGRAIYSFFNPSFVCQ